MMNEGCFPELYNAIYYSLYDHKASKNYFGFAETTSHIKAIKIWSLASDWESLITGQCSNLIVFYFKSLPFFVQTISKGTSTSFPIWGIDSFSSPAGN